MRVEVAVNMSVSPYAGGGTSPRIPGTASVPARDYPRDVAVLGHDVVRDATPVPESGMAVVRSDARAG
ncbi:MAG: hypothetical protein KY439_12305 [Actinobacteria bacterium]|nr:hypothetical protein [Actinomycetota bacterium]